MCICGELRCPRGISQREAHFRNLEGVAFGRCIFLELDRTREIVVKGVSWISYHLGRLQAFRSLHSHEYHVSLFLLRYIQIWRFLLFGFCGVLHGV